MADVLLMFLAMLAGPSLAAIILTVIVDGLAGLRALLSRMGRWRANVRWYGVAFCTIPLLLLVLLFPLTLLVSSVYAPGVQIAGFAIGLAAGFFEELGWISFALPGMRARLSPLAARDITLREHHLEGDLRDRPMGHCRCHCRDTSEKPDAALAKARAISG